MYAIQVESRSSTDYPDQWITVMATTYRPNALEVERDYRRRGYPTRVIRYGETTTGAATSILISSNGQAPQD